MTASISPATPGPSADRPGADLGHPLVAQLRSELRKTYATSTWWALLIPAALLSLLVTLATSQGGGLAFTPALGMAVALGSFSAKLAVVYGLVTASAEHRHRTITTTYLVAPRRPLVTVAKALVAGLVGAVYAAVSAVAGLLGVLFAEAPTDTQPGALFGVCATAMLTFALWAMLGVGIATLLTSQLAAIVSVLVYLLLVEQVIAGLTNLLDQGQINGYLPGGSASAALTELAGEGPLGGDVLGVGALPWWLALLIFAGYTAVAVLAGATAAHSRDVT